MPDFLWKWRKEILFALLILISLGLLVSQRKPGILTSGLRQGVALVVVPLQKASTSAVRHSRAFFSLFTSLGSLRSENTELLRQCNQLKLENAQLAEITRENEVLREELVYRKHARWHFLPAEIIGRDPATWLGRAVIGSGSAEGILLGAGVVTAQGVVGRVSEVNLHSSTLMLLPDAQSSVAVSTERSRVPATIKGAERRWLSLMHVAGGDDVKVNDVVITSNVSSIFPPGLVVGDVVSVAPADTGLMLSIRVKPRVDFQKLVHVLIIKPEP